MVKGQDAKKTSKKKAVKTLKEKRIAKKDKKATSFSQEFYGGLTTVAIGIVGEGLTIVGIAVGSDVGRLLVGIQDQQRSRNEARLGV